MIAHVLPGDRFFPESVASVSGFITSGAAIVTTMVFELAGYISDPRPATGMHLLDPWIVLAGLIPFVGMILALVLVRNTKATKEGSVRKT
jgi:MFS transporter, ACS family, hexuronate transporter